MFKRPRTQWRLLLILFIATLLRFVNLESNPPALYWDEASIGYNAFSILKAGIDEHGVRFPITHFLAYGDAKPPVYIYAVSAAMAMFGVGELAVRLPSALSGVVAVYLSFLISRQLVHFYKSDFLKTGWISEKVMGNLPVVVSLGLAVSPWHINLSRAGFEANLALSFFLLGLWAFLTGLKQSRYWLIAAVSWVLTLYTFNSYRIFLPLFAFGLSWLFARDLIRNWKMVGVCLLVSLVLATPLIPFVLSDQAKLRFNEVTILNNHEPIWRANQAQQLNNNAWWTKIAYNRRVFYAFDFLKGALSHLDFSYLFISGDENPRFSTQFSGQLHLAELPFLIIGALFVISTKGRFKYFLALLLVSGLVPAALAREVPHALRSLQVILVFYLIIALGVVVVVSRYKRLIYIYLGLLIICVSQYLQFYHTFYPQIYASSWQYGYKQLVGAIKILEDDYDFVYVSDLLGRPHTYLLFYLQVDPRQYLQTRRAGGDAFGFTSVASFGKFRFYPPIVSEKPKDEKWLVVANKSNIDESAKILQTIPDINSKDLFVIYEAD